MMFETPARGGLLTMRPKRVLKAAIYSAAVRPEPPTPKRRSM